ncbi:MAG: fibronectin type III domain-containing protein [Bacteroidota bacterium]
MNKKIIQFFSVTRSLQFALMCLILILGISTRVNAQVANYSFSQTTGTYTPITGGTLLSAVSVSNDDNTYAAVPIGFTFNYNGTNYTTIGVNSNGYVALGGTAPSSFYDGTSIQNVVNACHVFSEDLMGGATGCEIQYITTGTSGSRIFTIQWKNWGFYNSGSTTGPEINFQLQFFEGSNIIRFNYSPGTISSTQTCQAGLTGAVTTDFKSRTGTGAWASSANSLVNTAQLSWNNAGSSPVSGLSYIWNPPPPCVAPTAQATSYVGGTTTASTIAGSFTAASGAPSGYLIVRYPTGSTPTAPVTGTTYTVGAALGLGTVVQSSASTSFTATGLIPSTTYDFYIYAYNNTLCSSIAYNIVSPLIGTSTTAPPAAYTSTTLGGLWSSTATWVGGIVPPSANDVVIVAGAIVTVDQAMNYNNLTINGSLRWNGTVNNLNLTGNLTIGSSGSFLPYTTAATPAAIATTITGDFINNGFANMSLSTVTFNRVSGTSTLGGTGTFTVDQNNKGMFAAILIGNAGTLNIATSQNLVCRAAFANLGIVNPGGKLSFDQTSVVYGQAFNLQVASVAVTAMGTLYTAAPVATCTGAQRWVASTAVTAGQIRFSGTNVYTASVGGTTSITAPTHTSGTATDGTVTWLWVGNTGTIGAAFQTTAPTVGNMYFYGNRLYVCTVTGTPSAAAPPVHTSGTVASGTASYRYVGTPASCSVNYDATTQTVRSLTLTSAGSGYSTAPAILIAPVNASGSGAAATAVIFTLVGNAASGIFNCQIGSGSSLSGPISAINNSQGVNSISLATGGVNYTVAPLIGIGFPTSQNLVTAGGSGYTTAPIVAISGGSTVTGFSNPTFTVTVNQGKVVSVYVATAGSGWLTAPTLTLTGGGGSGATCAFPAGCLATATANIGSNGQITGFTITNPGSGYIATSPTCVVAGGTFTTAAATPVARVGSYGVNYSWFGPISAPSDITTGFEIPSDRRMNNITIGNSTNTVIFNNNLTLTGTAPTTWTSGMVNLGGNTLTYTWNGYAGANLISPNFGVRNGSITLTGRGGGTTGSTWNFPFINGSSGSFTAFTGSGTDGSNGSDITSMTVTETGAPSGGAPGNAPIGTRAFRVQTPAGTTYGASPNVNMRWNPSDAIDGTTSPGLTNQSDLTIGESSSLTGPTWTIRSAAFGASGAVPANGALGTLPSSPGPIANTTSKFYAYINTQVAPTITSFSPTQSCANAGIVTITGTGFKNITSSNVTIGGTPVLFIVSYTSTQIIARVGAGTTGPIAVTTSGGTATSLTNFTVTTLSGLVTPTRTPTTGLVCNAGGTVALDATQTGAISYSWTGAGLSSTTIANPIASPLTTTQYIVDIDMGVCTASYYVNVGVLPPFTFTPSSSVDTICFASPSIAVNMNANLSSSGFTVTSVPYTLYTPPAIGTTTLVQAGVATPALTSGTLDDGGWASVPLGFNYNFFGNIYNSVNVGTNGVLQFGTYNATSLGDFTYLTSFPTTTEPTNIIALMANDLWFNSTSAPGYIKYWNDGVAPTRRFFIQYSSVNTCCSAANPTTTVTAVLYETIGNVEIHITNTNSTNSKTVGLQDLTGTIGAVAPGRGSFTGTITTPEAWKFVPPSSYTFNWSASSGVALSSTTIVNPVATVSSAPASNYDNYTLSVTATNPITACASTQVDSFKVFNTPTAPTANNYIECSSPTVAHASVTSTASAYSTHTYKWYSAATGGVLLQSGPHNTYDSLITQSTRFYVSEVNGNCESPRVAVFDSVPTLSVSSSPLAICAVGGSVTLTATPTIGGTFSWSGGPFTTLSSTSISANPTTTTNYTVTETSGSCSISKIVSVGVYAPTVFTPTSSVDSICFASPSVTVNMNANLSGTTFAITAEPYAPYTAPGSGITVLANAGTIVTPQTSSFASLDDGGWRVPIGFTYNFLGTIVDSINIGTNGVIQFGPFSDADLSDFTYLGLPSTTEPRNIIAGCATDLYWSTAGTIRTWVTGIAPNRTFVVSYEGGAGFITDGTHTFQIVLHETIGTAEVIVTTATSTAHNKTIGCNNSTGLVGSTAPGRNAFSGTFGPEAWLFTPPASYTFAWTGTGLSSSTVVNPNAVISTSPTGAYDNYVYSVAATNTATGCTTTRSDSFKVFQTPAAPTTTPGTRCGVGTVALSSSSPIGTAQWYDVPTGGTVLATTSSYTASITATDTFYVAYKNGTCEGPRSMVIATMTPPPALVMGARDTTCLGSPVILSVSSPTEPTYTYAWSPGTLTGASPSVNPTSTTTYTVTATSASGCVNVGTQVVVVNPVPSTVTISTNPLPVCFGIGSDTLIASGGTVGSTAVISTTGTSPTTSTGTESFFYRTWEGAKHQYLISASELTAMGYSAGNLNSLSVNNTTTIPVNSNFDNLSINIGHTTATALTTTFLPTPGTTVYGPANYNVVLGANTFTFSTPFTWDGTQNILIEVCFDNDPTGSCTSSSPICWGNTFAVDAATTSFTSCNYQYSDNTAGTPRTFCSSPTGTTGTSSLRPIFTFDYSSSVPTNITWSPVTDLYVDAAGTTPYTTGLVTNTVYSRATTSRAYFATATVPSTGCFTNSASTTVLVNAPGTGGCPVAPRNDNICTPLTLNTTLTTSLPYSVAGYANINTHTDTTYQSNTYATRNVGEPLGSCGASGLNNKTMWYKFTAPFCATPQVHISTDDRSSTDFNTRVSVYRRAAPYSCTSAFTEVACNDNATYYLNTGSTTNSTVVLTPNSASPAYGEYAPGEDLYIQTSGYSAASGNYGLIIDAEPYIPVVGAVGSGTAVIDWSTSMTSPWGGILGTYIQWRPVGAGSTVAGTYAYIPGPSSTYTITGLLPGTAYEFWASYTCGNGGRWWSKKGTFTTTSSCVGTSPSIVSVIATTPCNTPTISFNATSLAYSSYRVIRRQIGSSVVLMSPAYYTSPSTQTYTSPALLLGRTYQFYVVAYCGTAKVDSSAISSYTVCASLRTANPNATEQVDEDKDVAYIMPNGTVVYGLPFNAMDLPFDATNPNEQTITLETMDANTYFGRDITPTTAQVAEGDLSIYPNPANTEATLSYTLEHESDVMNIQVLDAQGKVMITDQIANPTMSGSYTINLNKYSAGVYFVKVQAGDYVQTKKLMVETK